MCMREALLNETTEAQAGTKLVGEGSSNSAGWNKAVWQDELRTGEGRSEARCTNDLALRSSIPGSQAWVGAEPKRLLTTLAQSSAGHQEKPDVAYEPEAAP